MRAPSPLDPSMRLESFDCGKAALTDWLKQKAAKAEGRSARCYVVTEASVAVAYYCLATGAVSHDEANAKLRRNMPDPIPIMLLGRLAIDTRYQGQGLGSALLKDAFQRFLAASQIVGASALFVHAIDDEAKAFYLKYGLRELAPASRTLYIPTASLVAALG